MVSPQPQILLDGSIKDTVQQARVEILRNNTTLCLSTENVTKVFFMFAI